MKTKGWPIESGTILEQEMPFDGGELRFSLFVSC